MRNFAVLMMLTLLFTLLQASFFFDAVRVFGVKPDLLLVLVAWVAFKRGGTEGQLTGFGSGLVQQFFSSALFGMWAFVFTVVGFVIGLAQRKVDADNFVTAMILVFAATVLKGLAIGFLALFFGEISLHFVNYLRSAFLVELVYTPLVAGPVFWALNRFAAPVLR